MTSAHGTMQVSAPNGNARTVQVHARGRSGRPPTETNMRNWTEGEVRRIVPADDLHVAPLRDDGFTHGMPNRIWAVVLDGNLYAHACNGTASR
ncbi:hypothetical protein GCM10011390_21390 [Aureimonas endophytica]|uniref:Uncharacterized protein n=1 Tax=Aureimonas endophytica TaxID=2027858 RepID=A0A916ZKG4_9HYPH|nr:hypothetical protein GCM10011390_21390 [Aureimonas endophytica]